MFRYLRERKRIEWAALTPEGWVYLVVLAFIAIGSVIRNVNLLILMAGMLAAPLFVNWRLAIHRLGRLKASRQLPRHLHANRVASIPWQAENRLRSMSAFDLMISDRIERYPESEQNLNTDGLSPAASRESQTPWYQRLKIPIWKVPVNPMCSETAVRYPRLDAGKTETRSYRVFFSQRGKYHAGPAYLSTTFPFGLIFSRSRACRGTTFFVAPGLGKLAPTWERRLRSSMAGSDSVQRSRALEEDEFYALRPWRSGDSKKNIHWRTTARMGYPIVKQHDQQNNRDFALVVDLFGAETDSQIRQNSERALSFATTALMELGNDVRGQVTVQISGRELVDCSSRSLQGVIGEALPALSVAQCNLQSAVMDAIVNAAAAVSVGTPIYVISTRPRPASLELMLPVGLENPAADRHDQSLVRRLRSALPMVRWLSVDGSEFKQLFTAPQDQADAPSSERMPRTLAALTDRWMKHAKH